MIATQSTPSRTFPAARFCTNGGTGPGAATRPITEHRIAASSGVAPASPVARGFAELPMAKTIVPILSYPPAAITCFK